MSACVSALSASADPTTDFLKVDGSNLTFRGKDVFLSGGNLAWIDYGNDFGNGQSFSRRCDLQDYIKKISEAGGNSIRIWLFVEGHAIPQWSEDGYVTSTDAQGTLVDDLKTYLEYAAAKNVFVTLCLWNGALMRNDNYKQLYYSEDKLNSFIDKALTPLVTGLKG